MAVRGFLVAFDNIDKDHDHVISHEDLKNYASEQNIPDAFVQVSLAPIAPYYYKSKKYEKLSPLNCLCPLISLSVLLQHRSERMIKPFKNILI